jgi:dihydroxy-acid dehydratase
MTRGLIRTNAKTVTGRSLGELCGDVEIADEAVIHPISRPLVERAGFVVMRGNPSTAQS